MDVPFEVWCKAYGIPKPELEYRFHPTRKFRWDACWPNLKLAVEIQGGVWNTGKHGRGSGIVKDYEKQNIGVTLGWAILQFVPSDIANGSAALVIQEALRSRIGERSQRQSGAVPRP